LTENGHLGDYSLQVGLCESISGTTESRANRKLNQLAKTGYGVQNGPPNVCLTVAALSGQGAQGRVLAIATEPGFEKSKMSV
jgi:hypothetical protein